MTYDQVKSQLQVHRHHWLITGVAGFIGSHLLETLLQLNQSVTGLDNFSTGHQLNLEQVRRQVTREQWERFRLLRGDLADSSLCDEAVRGVDFVLHEAALGSVPRSMVDPLATHHSNVTGFVTLLVASKNGGVKRFIFASSSAVYGDDPALPRTESRIGKPLSPYAATKAMNEVYADTFARAYGLESIGLRYFNVFGPRQDPQGSYAAVIPRWMTALAQGEPAYIYGDGENSRDFCFVADVVQANLLAALTSNPGAVNQVYNVASGQRITLKELFKLLQASLRSVNPALPKQEPICQPARDGDILHSLGDIRKAQQLLGYQPRYNLSQGLSLMVQPYRAGEPITPA
jgi:UDP-N-acetylglucosamine/UDP-N-acetylgalactosamine 4-epimerase